MKIPTTLDRKKIKKWLICPALALLLVLSSLPVYAGEQQIETSTVTQDTGSESAESAASSEQDEPLVDEFDGLNASIAVTTELQDDPPHEGAVLNGGYVGFKNKASGKYLTIPDGSTTAGTNVCQQSANNIANAQEFYLSYTHNVKKNISYFTILPVDSTGATTQTRVKAATLNASGQANVSLQYHMPTESTDRWQIKHAYGNYYYIYIASNLETPDIKYALTAYGMQNGTAEGSMTNSQGNVYVSPFMMMDIYQLWEICVDGIPTNINGINAATVSNTYVALNESVNYFFIPKRYNTTIEWRGENGVDIQENGTAIGENYGIATIIMTEKMASTGFFVSSKSISSTVMPAEGYYFISNASTMGYLGSTATITNVPLQISDVAHTPYYCWYINHDEIIPGYFTIQSVYNGLYVNINPSNPTSVHLSYVEDGNTRWRVEAGKLGNAILMYKDSPSANDALILSLINNETSLNMASYVSDSQYYDEWDLYPYYFDYSVHHYYDAGFDVRFPGDDNVIDEYQVVCTNVLLALFGVHTRFQTYDYHSCADECSGLPMTLEKTEIGCDCGGEIDHKAKATIRDDLIEQFGEGDEVNSRYAWTGHDLDSSRSDSSSGSHTVIMTLQNFDIRNNYIYTLLHETSHQLGAPDHYCYAPLEPSPCSNRNCFRCVKGKTPPSCLMTSRIYDIESKLFGHTLNTLYCEQCKSFSYDQGIGTHLIDHH